MASSSSSSSSSDKWFLEACYNGDLDRLKRLVEESGGVEMLVATIDGSGRSCLHYASAQGHRAVCAYLIEEIGVDIDAQDSDGATPLLNAVVGNHPDTVEYLLQKRARSDLENNRGISPLSFVCAAEKGETDQAESSSGSVTGIIKTIFELLITAAFKSEGTTLACKTYGLVWAASTGKISLLKILAREVDRESRGQKNTLVDFSYGAQRKSLLHYAAYEGQLEACKYLVEQMGHACDVRDARGETPLLNAIQRGQVEVALSLISCGASCDLSNDRGFTPVHYAAERGYPELLRLLLSSNADVDAVSCIGTPLQIVARQGRDDIVKILLEFQANVNICLGHVHTPLVGAIIAKSVECVKHLIEANANVDMVSSGVTALYMAACEGETDIVKMLLKATAQPNLTVEEGLAPIEIAAINSHHDVVQILFPVTSPISAYSDWSLSKILSLANPQSATEAGKLKKKEMLLDIKNNGDLAMCDKAYGTGIFWYTKYLGAEPSDAGVLSKRSRCWAELGFGNLAVIDALESKKLKPSLQEAYYREGVGWNILQRFDKAAEVFVQGLKLDHSNELLETAAREAFKARKSQLK